jgi:hypothetical protein
MRKVLSTFILLTIATTYNYAQTSVNGNVSGTWTLGGSPYIINGSVTIPTGQSLQIQAGVTVKFPSSSSVINVLGTLLANGTSVDSVRFFGGKNSNYTYSGFINIQAGSLGSSFQYASIDSMGNPANNFATIRAASSLNISNSSIRNSYAYGVQIERSNVAISNSSFSALSINSYNIYIPNDTIAPTIQNCSFSGSENAKTIYTNGGLLTNVTNNSNAIILVEGVTKQNSIWTRQAANSSFKVNNLTIAASQTLTIQQGCKIIFHTNSSSLNVFGTLLVNGTIADSVKLLGTKNPIYAYGGLINIQAGSTGSTIQFASIDSMGNPANNFAAIRAASSLNISNSNIRNSYAYGVQIERSNVAISNSSFSASSINSYNIYIPIDSVAPTIQNCSFDGNENARTIFTSGCSPENITNNYYTFIDVGAIKYTREWKKQNVGSFFKVNNTTINSGITLTIQPGVRVLFPNYASIFTVNGTLIANGTTNDSIYFWGRRSHSSYAHSGVIRFELGSSNSSMKFVSLDSMGTGYYGQGAIRIADNISITNSLIKNSYSNGITILADSLSPTISNNRFAGNESDRTIYSNSGLMTNVSNNTNAIIEVIATINKNASWQKQGNGSYFKSNTVTLNAGKTLTVQPGVRVLFPNYASIFTVNGTLIANGTTNDSIYFWGTRSHSSYAHSGVIRFELGSSNSSMKFVSLDSMGTGYYGQGAIRIADNISITNSLIKNSYSNGITILADSLSPTISNNTFFGNETDRTIYGTLNNFTNFNTNKNCILYFINSTISGNTTIRYPGSNSYYLFKNNLSIPSNTTLTIEPGVLLDFNTNFASISISGTLRALGSESSNVNFTRFNSIGTNYGGSITFNNNSSGIINNASFTRLGNSSNAIVINSNVNLKISSIVVSDNANTGIRIAGSSPLITNSTITKNVTGISVTSGKPIFTNCNILANSSFGINNISTTDTVDARNCWWGHLSGPLHSTTNPTGLGNTVSNRVLYTPWRNQPTGNQVNDIGVSAILTPISNCNLTSTETVRVRISNFGNIPQSGFSVSYQLNNGTTVTENVTSITLLSNASIDYSFTTRINLSVANTNYNLKVYTSLLNDTLRNNDTLTTIIQHLATLAAPTNLIPVNNAINVVKPVNFSWVSVSNAISYDLFIWPTTGTVPITPTVSGIKQINYTYNSGILNYGSSYNWKVRAVRNSCTTESIVQQFTIRNLPDLVVSEITAPPTAVSETTISFSWKVRNQGIGSTNTVQWLDRVYLSDAPQLNVGNDYIIGTYQNTSTLNANQLYQSLTQTFMIPQGFQGQYYLIVITDINNQVEELVESNNRQTSTPINITLTPPPDLQVSAIAASPSTLFSEDSVTVNWTIKNNGTGPTTNATQWNDWVYISANPVFNLIGATLLANKQHTGSLGVNASYNETIKVKLPINIQGTYYIHVLADASNLVYEYAFEDNNSETSNALNILLRPAANLVVDTVSIPADTLSIRQTVNVQWTVSNIGSININKPWTDRIYISFDNQFSEAADIWIGSFNHNNSLQSLSSTSLQQAVTIPNNLIEGNYYFFVKADANNSINEHPNENDNVSNAFGPIFIGLPDLTVPIIQSPTTGQSETNITVNYTARNIGKGNLLSGSWTDGIYLSTDNNFSNNDIFLGATSVNNTLFRNSEYNKQVTVTLPSGISGNYFILVVTDIVNTVNESNQNNNTMSSAITITLSPWADLVVTSINPTQNVTAGRNITVNYTVNNNGTGNILNKQWRDDIFLSPTNSLSNPNNILLGSIQQNRSLNSTTAYNQQANFIIPISQSSGQYYIVVATDATNTIFENTGETNNRMVSAVINVASLPNIDLAVISGNTSTNTITAGQSIQASYTIRNASNSATLPIPWTDAIYLSNNTVIDAGDRLLESWLVNSTLQANGTTTQTRTIIIPKDASGSQYLIVLTDQNNVQNDINRGNNFLTLNTSGSGGQPIIITQPTPVDLQAISLIAPLSTMAGQPFTVKYTVKNNGPGATFVGSWQDDCFIGTSTTSTTGNPILSKSVSTLLVANASYTDSVQLLPSINQTGNYVIVFQTDATNRQFELNKEDNNRASLPIIIQAQNPCDLKINSITPPINVQIAGQNTTIQWQLFNSGQNPANGYFKEAVYLSADTSFDANTDILLGTVDGNINILPQQSLSRQLNAALNNVTRGQFYIIIRTDILNNLLESNENNNQLVSLTPITIEVKELLLATATNDTLFNNRSMYYRIVIPSNLKNETMRLKLLGDSAKKAVNRLFLSYAQVPSSNTYDFASEIPFSANQQITVPYLQAGTYYLNAIGNDTSALKKQVVTLDARIIPFGIDKVESNKGGNTGLVTIRITGAKFDQSTNFRLRSDAFGYINSYQVYYIDPTQVFVTYNLLNSNKGQYHVIATKANGDSAKLVNGFEIIKDNGSSDIVGGGGTGSGFTCQIINIGFEDNLKTSYVHPSSIRFGGQVLITVYFENTGNVDIPVPTRFFNSLTPNVPVAFLPAELSKKYSELILECKEQNGPPGILRPGGNGFFKIYSVATATGNLNYTITE